MFGGRILVTAVATVKQMGRGLTGVVGGGGGMFFSAVPQGGSLEVSQSGRWRNHLPTTSRHPPHTQDAPSTCDNLYNKSAHENDLMASYACSFQACQEDMVPCRKQEILDSLVYIRACDPESMHG